MIRAIDAVTEAAVMIEDPLMQRVTKETWRVILNVVQRRLATELDVLEAEATFDLLIDTRFAYPAELVRVHWIKVTDTPDEPDSFREVAFMPEDEFRANTNGYYPTASVPTHYHPRHPWWHPWPSPDVETLDGGQIAYFFMASDVVDIDSDILEFPDVVRPALHDLLMVFGLRAMKQYEEAREYERTYNETLPERKTRIEARSDDRRKRLRAVGPGSAGAQA